MRRYAEVPSAASSRYALVGSVTVSISSSVRTRPGPKVLCTALVSVLAPSVRQNGRLKTMHSMPAIMAATASSAASGRHDNRRRTRLVR